MRSSRPRWRGRPLYNVAEVRLFPLRDLGVLGASAVNHIDAQKPPRRRRGRRACAEQAPTIARSAACWIRFWSFLAEPPYRGSADCSTCIEEAATVDHHEQEMSDCRTLHRIAASRLARRTGPNGSPRHP